VAELSAVPFDLGKALHENGKLVGQGRVEQTVPIQSSVDESLDLRRKNHCPWMRQETNALGRLSQ
jgi:hypothetical protein